MQKVQVHNLLSKLTPISLKGLDSVKLLNRVDRKYIIPINRLSKIIQLLSNHYSILEIDGRRAFSYITTYYDTTDFKFFRDHHNRVPSRIKVRSRTYKESNLHFFEVKAKRNGRTNKYREVLNCQSSGLTDEQSEKIKSIYAKELADTLIPTLLNTYTRITLVNKEETERCTIDLNLSFRDMEAPDEEIQVSDIAIIEVKQSKTSVLNGIVASLRTMQVPPSSISKYVLGLILTHPEIKHNSFKPLLHKIEKIKQQ